MYFPAIVDVGIGMIIIYIAGALLVSGIQEILASILQWRSQHLKESILQIMLGYDVSDEDLQSATNLRDKVYKSPLIQSVTSTSVSFPSRGLNFSLSLGQKLLPTGNSETQNSEFDNTQPLPSNSSSETQNPELDKESERYNDAEQNTQKPKVKNFYKKSFLTSFPSYISKENFATSLVNELCKDMLEEFLEDVSLTGMLGLNTIRQEIKKNNELPEPLKDSMLALVDRAAFKIDAQENAILVFQKEIENWFDSAMDRASGVYKRNGHLVAGVLGLAIVIFFNLDSFSISQKLMNDSTLRTLLADSASSLVVNSKTDPSDPNSQLDSQKLQDNIAMFVGSSLPVVPIYENAANFLDCENQDSCTLWPPFSQKKSFNFKRFFQAVMGWMATTLAIHMGAPFWFDLLGKVVNVRSTGSKPNGQN